MAQYIPTVLTQFIEDETKKQKEISIYLLDTSSKAKAPFILDTYRISKTLGIAILNEHDLGITIQPYNTFQDWKYAKAERQRYNQSNQSSYAIEEEDGYTIFGKLYGANGKESAFMACELAQIARLEHKQLRFVQVREHGTESISSSDRRLLESYGINISNESIVLENREFNNRSTCRRQDEFKYNLLQKYGEKKCYLCGCNIESTIIASHIHRITDIDNSSLNTAEKRRQAVDADNGFWLCANHDKMFENGIITFNQQGNLVLNPHLTQEQVAFVQYITKVLKINDSHLTEQLIQYLIIHNNRVQLS